MRLRKCFAFVMIMALVFVGCSGQREDLDEVSKPAEDSREKEEGYFSKRDFETEYDPEKCAYIALNGDTAECDSDAVEISEGIVTIKDEGTYVLSGTLKDGMIIVDSQKTDKTQLVLSSVNIHSETGAPIYIRQSDKVFITLASETENVLSNGGSFVQMDDNNIDAVIFSKEDVTLNGSGSLTITSPTGHGVVSKDEISITGGTYRMTTAAHGISGKDNICIADGTFHIISGKDGMQAENEEDDSLGYLYLQGGDFCIESQGDGLSGMSILIENGTYQIVTGGGSENAEKQTSDVWGGFMGGGRPGGMGGKNSASTAQEKDSTSIKGIKADTQLEIKGGSFAIDSADDGVHCNGDVKISGGNFEIASGDDAFHADDTLSILEGIIEIRESYEGLEGLHVEVSGGDIRLVSGDDGLNAAGGTDASGFGGLRGNDRFGGGAASKGSVVISGGSVYIQASGDGIDANGTLTISGGEVTVCGPTQGDTAVLDYDVSAVITGGTFVGTGSRMMAQTFSDSEQGVAAVSVGSQTAGTQVVLKDEKGNTIMACEPELPYAIVILSSPDIQKGQKYTMYVGELSGEVEAQ